MKMAPKSKSSQVFKILGVLLGVGVFLVVVLIGVIFYYLPSAKQLGSYFKKDKPTQSQISQVSKTETATLPAIASQDVTVNAAQHNYSDDGIASTESNEKNQEFEKLKEFIDEKTPAMTFCHKLNKAKLGPITALAEEKFKEVKNADGTTTKIDSTFDTEDLGDDLRLEAIKPFFKTVLRQPEMQTLISMVMQDEQFKNSKVAEQEGLFSKALFYKQAYSAYSEMKEKLPEYESIVDRSYLMYKLNDLIALKPALQSDPRIMKFCEESEYQSNSYAPVDFNSEKQVFERLIQELGVDPRSIKYDPNYKTVLDLKFSGNNLQIGGGWLNDLMPTRPQTTTQ